MLAMVHSTSGCAASTFSTWRTAASVWARDDPSGVSIETMNWRSPALGNRLKPIDGTRATLPASSRPPATRVVRGWPSDQCSTGRYDISMARLKPRRTRLPRSSASRASTALARNGTMVSDTSSEARMVRMTATGRLRMKSPALPGRNRSGTNANTSAAVQPRTATAIWRVARMAASRRLAPSRRWRVMFSTTTMESSTSRPSAMTKPTMLSWFMPKPARCSSARPIASDSGIDTMTMSDARMPSGMSVTRTSRMAMAKSRYRWSSRWATLPDWSKPRSSEMPGGSSAAKASATPRMRPATSKTFSPSFCVTVTKTAGTPL